MERDQNIPDVFFPEHLRLSASARNWAEYKHAVETVCRLKGVAENLTSAGAGLFAHRVNIFEDEPDDWSARDELCKAVITLNVKDFPRYGVLAGEDVPARAVWARLVEMHTPRPKKRFCARLEEWLKPMLPTPTEWMLLVLLVLAVLLLGEMEAALKKAHAECRAGSSVYAARVASYDDLVRYYRGR